MKIHIKYLFLVAALIAGLGLVLTNPAAAQTYTPLYSFTNSPDGAYPQGDLVLSGNTLYGTTSQGGILNSNNGLGNGTVFAININGSGYTNLYLFGSTNNDGFGSDNGLFLSGNTLYGTTYGGGVNGNGTVFSLHTNGSNYVILHNFSPTVLDNVTGHYTNSDGATPQEEGVILSGSTLYGTAQTGGTNGSGTVFAMSTGGSNYITLHNFGPWNYDTSNQNQVTNSAGASPESTLLLSGNTLYGTTTVGGTNGNGTVFAMSTGGSNFMTLHVFGAWGLNTNLNSFTNNDGAYPQGAGLILSGNTLYGTTCEGGPDAIGITQGGTIFSLSTNGTNFKVLYAFSGDTNGSFPLCGLTLSGNTLFGTTVGGAYGTVFSLNTSGSNHTVLHPFKGTPDVGDPQGLMLSGNTLYGTGVDGGTNDDGMVFSLTVVLPSVPPQLAIFPSGTNVILAWPTNAAGFTLESATNLAPPVVWITNTPAPVIVGTNNAVTNGISGTRKFYRLSQ